MFNLFNNAHNNNKIIIMTPFLDTKNLLINKNNWTNVIS